MKKRFWFLFKTWLGGWIMYMPYYLLMALPLWIGYLLMKIPYHLTYWQLLGFVMCFRVMRGISTKAGNIIIAQIVKKQIAQDAWDEALSRIQPIKFEDWWKKYKDTISE